MAGDVAQPGAAFPPGKKGSQAENERQRHRKRALLLSSHHRPLTGMLLPATVGACAAERVAGLDLQDTAKVALEDDWFEARAPEAGQDGAVVDIDNEMQVVDDMDAMDNDGGAAAQEEEVADMDDLDDMDAMMEEENNN